MKEIFEGMGEYIGRYWTSTLLLLGSIGALAGLLFFKLGSLTGGMSGTEAALFKQVSADQITIAQVLQDPFFLPYKLGLFFSQLLPAWPASLRSVSVVLGFIGVIGFYIIVRSWFTRRLAILSTVLFACSSWLLHISRYASVDSMYVSLVFIIASWVWVRSGKHPRLAVITALFASTLGLYIPGFIWFLVLAVIWQRKTIRAALLKTPLQIVIPAAVLASIALIPLIFAFVAPSAEASTVMNLLHFIGLPTNFPNPLELLRNLISIPLQLFVISPADSLLSIGRLPLLDIFTGAMVLLGFFVLVTQYKLDRAKIILTILGLGWILIALNGPVHISLLLPFMYLLAAEGIAYLMTEWMAIFPRNPFPRIFGVVVISIAVAVSCAFQLTSYFIAWPHTDLVKSTFTHHP